MRSAKPGVEALRLVAVMAMLLVAALEAAAQAPPHVLGFSPPAVRALDQEHAMDLQALDAFSGKRRGTEGLSPLERPEPWTLYGRLGLLNFQNQLAPDSSGTQLSLRRTGPGLGGRIYIGIRRRF
jgi:hypothetical protein